MYAKANPLVRFEISPCASNLGSVYIYNVGRFIINKKIAIDKGLALKDGSKRASRSAMQHGLYPFFIFNSPVTPSYLVQFK